MPSGDNEDAVERARSRVLAVDQIFQTVPATSPVHAWGLEPLFDDYVNASRYPLVRLPGFADRAIDLKLQYQFVLATTVVHNEFVFLEGFDLRNPQNQPRLHLRHLGVMQSLIGQVRILWERLMTLVYYLEEGADPEGKSIQRVFFRSIADWQPRWDVLTEWQPVIARYDTDYRTPEYHSRSRMRKELFGAPATDPNAIMAPLTPVVNGFWEVLTAKCEG